MPRCGPLFAGQAARWLAPVQTYPRRKPEKKAPEEPVRPDKAGLFTPTPAEYGASAWNIYDFTALNNFFCGAL